MLIYESEKYKVILKREEEIANQLYYTAWNKELNKYSEKYCKKELSENEIENWLNKINWKNSGLDELGLTVSHIAKIIEFKTNQ